MEVSGALQIGVSLIQSPHRSCTLMKYLLAACLKNSLIA